MNSEGVWRILVELIVPPETVDGNGGMGFNNIFVWAGNGEEALGKVAELVAAYKWTLISNDDPCLVDIDEDAGDYNDLIDDVFKNHNHMRYATFQSYQPS